MSQLLTSGGVMLAAAAASAAAIPLALRFGWSWRAIDRPNHRKRHETPVPRTGGVAVACGLLGGFLVMAVIEPYFPGHGGLWSPVAFTAATALVFVVGLADDIRGCSVGVKLAVQFAAALLVVSTGTAVPVVHLPTGGAIDFGLAGYVIAVIWLIGVTNAVNFMDGLDGLAGGMAAIISASLAVFAVFVDAPLLATVAAVICGACLGFLPFNWRPARIFLGDSGSLTIGFALATLSLTASLKSSTVLAILVPLLALGVPAIDAVLVVLTRFTERVPGRTFLQRLLRMSQADRLHVHHHGVDAFRRHEFVVFLVYAIVVCSCVFTLAAAVRSNPALAAATVVVEIIAIIAIRLAGIRARSRGSARNASTRSDPSQPAHRATMTEQGMTE